MSVQHWHCHLSTHVCVCVQVEMGIESLVMMRKQLLQLWNSSVLSLRRRDEDLSKMQEDVR